jgi:RHS repeat-associated protein
MKPYSYLLIFLLLGAFWLSGCSSQKQLPTASNPVKADTIIRTDIPHYIPQLKYTFQPYHFKPKQVAVSPKERYEQAFNDLKAMLDGKAEPDFELAVFLSENPYHNGRFTYQAFQQSINEQINVVRGIIAANDHSDTMNFDAHVNQYGSFNLADLRYLPKDKKELYRKALSNWAVFKYLTDTITRVTSKDKILELYRHTPKIYASADPFGMKDWRHSQVINLLTADSNTGNCFALTALFKILSDRLNGGSRICTAPQHIYIQHQDQNGHYYNVELATAGHPADGIIQTLTHTPSDAIVSGIALRDYTTKQSIGLCLVNLAKSYEHKFNTRDDGFMLRCADLALRYDSLNLNALLLKAQVLDARVTSYARNHKINTIEVLRADKVINGVVIQLEKHLARLAQLGYRQMPVDMQEMIMNPLQYDPKKWDHKSRNPRPFTTIKVQDPKDEEYWTLTKGIFQEVFEPRALETYGHFTINIHTRQLVRMDTTTVKGFIIDPVAFAYDFGARMYDAKVGRFLSVDPKAYKYSGHSPYHFGYNNPMITIDPDGRENIVVVGGQPRDLKPQSDRTNPNFGQDALGHNKRHFLEAGLNEALMLKVNETTNGERTKILVYNAGYTQAEIDHYTQQAVANGIDIEFYQNKEGMVDYINNQNGNRSDDAITNFTYFGHGSANGLWVGYNGGSGGDEIMGTDLNSNAFSSNSYACLWGCNNGVIEGGSVADDFVNFSKQITAMTGPVWWGQNSTESFGMGLYMPNNFRGNVSEYRIISGNGGTGGSQPPPTYYPPAIDESLDGYQGN